MSGNQTGRSWQDDLIARYSPLFCEVSRGGVATPGHPRVGDSWRQLVKTAVNSIATAVAAAPFGPVDSDRIKQKFGAP